MRTVALATQHTQITSPEEWEIWNEIWIRMWSRQVKMDNDYDDDDNSDTRKLASIFSHRTTVDFEVHQFIWAKNTHALLLLSIQNTYTKILSVARVLIDTLKFTILCGAYDCTYVECLQYQRCIQYGVLNVVCFDTDAREYERARETDSTKCSPNIHKERTTEYFKWCPYNRWTFKILFAKFRKWIWLIL